MKTFYSILFCPIRPVVDEQLSIALFVRSEDKVFFRYSHDKLKIIKELLPASAYNLLKSSLKNIDEYFAKRNEGHLSQPDLFGNLDNQSDRFLKPDYFKY